MKKTVCDLCGMDCQETGFLIPEYYTCYATGSHGVKLMAFDGIEKVQMDLCPRCADLVAGQIKYLRDNIGHIVAQDEAKTEDHNPALDVRTPPITGGKI